MVQSGSGSADASGTGSTTSAPTESYLRSRERGENFPVALRVLPGRPRRHLRAVYDVARVIDDLGDRADGDRTARLKAFRDDLAAVWHDGSPRADVLRRLVPTVRACGLPREPFDSLIDANLWDQQITRYRTFAELREYCVLSADPVGRLVLAIFGASSARTVELSDDVCTALQLIEHCQDVAEDRRAGRVYLPQQDLTTFGVPETDLDDAETSARLRRLIAFETDRAGALLASGKPLVGMLRGWARLAVAGYVAGGLAAIDGIRSANWSVMSGSPGTSRLDVLRHLYRLLRERAAS